MKKKGAAKKTGKGKTKPKPIAFRLDPKLRMTKPLYIKEAEEFPTLAFFKKTLDSRTPFKSEGTRRKIYPTQGTKPKPGDLKFSGKFECGNLDTVYSRGENAYEIHLCRDPGKTAQWYFFRCENFTPGEYTFVITGFHRDTGIHHHGVLPVALSMNAREHGISWMRFGKNLNYWKSVSGSPSEYTISFTFTVESPDTIFFAYTYPYTFTKLTHFLSHLPPWVKYTTPCSTSGGLQIPVIFWDSDNQTCVELKRSQITKDTMPKGKNPMIIITARHHPGETCSSFAMEGFLKFVFSDDQLSFLLRQKFSILIIPMLNIDGVVCGFYRPGLGGVDLNRIWKKNQKTEARTITALVDKLSETRKVLFFLDFHGHAGQWNAFSYGVRDKAVPLNEYQAIFTRIMSQNCPFYDFSSSYALGPKAYERTMRVAYHHRYQIPFSYTLEISLGGCDLIKPLKQFTPKQYREIGRMTGISIYKLLCENVEILGAMKELNEKPVPRPESRKVAGSVGLRRPRFRAQTPSSMTPRNRTPRRSPTPRAVPHSANNSESDLE